MVVCVDWKKGAVMSGRDALGSYLQAVINSRIVGAQTHSIVKKLSELLAISHAHIHCIGFSLGAHVCGFLGKMTIGLGRISGR